MSWILDGAGAQDVALIFKVVVVVALIAGAIGFVIAKLI